MQGYKKLFYYTVMAIIKLGITLNVSLLVVNYIFVFYILFFIVTEEDHKKKKICSDNKNVRIQHKEKEEINRLASLALSVGIPFYYTVLFFKRWYFFAKNKSTNILMKLELSTLHTRKWYLFK